MTTTEGRSDAPVADAEIDLAAWADRWNERMRVFFPGRDASIETMLDLVARLLPEGPQRILDLGSGPGHLSGRLVARFPTATVVALDFDPVLLQIGRGALGDANGQLQWAAANLRETDWPAALSRFGPFDAVLSLATLHHFPARDVRRVYDDLASLIRPGGLFLNAEGMAPGRPGSRLTEAVREARLGDRPNPDTWWADVEATPALAPLAAERRALLARFPTDRVRLATAERHCRDLRTAGFVEAAIVWRQHDETIVAAIR